MRLLIFITDDVSSARKATDGDAYDDQRLDLELGACPAGLDVPGENLVCGFRRRTAVPPERWRVFWGGIDRLNSTNDGGSRSFGEEGALCNDVAVIKNPD